MKSRKMCGILLAALMAIEALSPITLAADGTAYDSAQGKWKFDFGSSSSAESGYINVNAGTNFTDNLQYGFLGTKNEDYKYKKASLMDSFSDIEGQKITLKNSSGSGTGADKDFVYSPKGSSVAAPNDFYDYTTANPIRFAMSVENGGYYHVKVTLANASKTESAKVSLFTERRHQLLTDAEIPADGTLTHEFNVDVETVYFKSISGNFVDDTISVTVTGVNAAISSMEVSKLNSGTTLWLMCDSTGCDQNCGYPYFPLQNYAGTGQGLTKYLPQSVALSNQGDGGINSGDKSHYNNVKLKKGDYLYAEWGHNEKSTDDYVTNLKKYYKDTVTAGANLIVVGPIDRSSKSQFDASTGKWLSTLNSYSSAGKKFVDDILTDTAYVQSILGSSYSDYTADQLDNIAFIDINAGWIDFLNTATNRYKTVMKSDKYDFQSVKFYYKADKSNLVENSHENDAGADNAAYIFFKEAKKTINDSKKESATEAQKSQAAVLRGLVSGMRSNTPYTVPETIMKGGDVVNGNLANVYYPPIVTESFEGYPARITKINKNSEGNVRGVMVKMSHNTALSAKNVTYALAVLKTGTTEYKTSMNTKYDVTNGNGTFELTFDKAFPLQADGKFSVWLQGLVEDTTALHSGDAYRFSEKYTQNDVSNVEDYLVGDYDDIEIPDTFSYYGIKNGSDLNGNNGWITYGSAQSTTVLTSSSLREYAAINNTGYKSDGTSQGSYYLYKPFSAGVSDGYIQLETDLYYNSGTLNFSFTKSKYQQTAGESVHCFTIDNNTAYINNDSTLNIPTGQWTHISYLYNYTTGKADLKIGNNTVGATLTPVSTALSYITLAGTNKKSADMYIDNLAVRKLTQDPATLPEPTPTPVATAVPDENKIENATVKLSETTYTYNGKRHRPDVTVKSKGSKTLTLDTDYTLRYDYDRNAGDPAHVTVTGAGDYSGKQKAYFTIEPYTITDDMVTLENGPFYINTGESAEPAVTVKVTDVANADILVKDTDYTVQYANNNSTGTGKITVTATGNYQGSVEKSFDILPLSSKPTETPLPVNTPTITATPSPTTIPTLMPTVEPTSTPVPTRKPIDGIRKVYSEDFEGDNHHFTSTVSGRDYHGTDKTPVNSHSSLIYGVGSNNSGYWIFDKPVTKIVTVDMDIKMDAAKKSGESHVSLLGSKLTTKSYTDGGSILDIRGNISAEGKNGYFDTITINGVDITKDTVVYQPTESMGSMGRDSTGWLNINAVLNFDTQKIDVTLTRKSNGNVIYSGTVDFNNQAEDLKEIYLSAPTAENSTQPEMTCVDNIIVMSTADPVEIAATSSPSPTNTPDATPTAKPTSSPTSEPTSTPTTAPTTDPTPSPSATPTPAPADNHNIKILNTAINQDTLNVTIDKGFTGIALAGLFDKNGSLIQLICETDNTTDKDLIFRKTDDFNDCTIRLFSWESFDNMKNLDSVQVIKLSEIKQSV